MSQISNLTTVISGSPEDTVTLSWSNPAWPSDLCGPPPTSNISRKLVIDYRKDNGAWTSLHNQIYTTSGSQITQKVHGSLAAGIYDYRVRLDDTYNTIDGSFQCVLQTETGASVYDYTNPVNSSDTTPDQFDLGAGNQFSELSVYTYSDWFTVTGITDPATVTPTGLQWRKNGGAWSSSSGTVNNLDNVQVRLLSASAYSTTSTGTLNIGGVSDTYDNKTKADPGNTQIDFPWTVPPNDLAAKVGDFFGPYGGPYSQTNYVRGGDYVPNIAPNNHVPTAPPIDLTDLLGTAIEFYAYQGIGDKEAVHVYDSSSGDDARYDGTGTKQVNWQYITDYLLAIGARGQAEFQFSWGIDTTEGTLDVTTSLAVNSGTAAPSWGRAVPNFTLLFDHNSADSHGLMTGWAQIKIRSVYDATKTITMTANWSFMAIDLNGLEG